MFYVDTVQMDKLVETGIVAMLEQLDPYTEFIPEEETESLELLTTGAYGGVGSLIKGGRHGGIFFSEPYEDYPAARAGIVPGDEILEVDGISTATLSVDECSNMMKGKPDTQVHFRIRKVKTSEEIEMTLRRERIHFSDIEWYGMVGEEIGYIRIGGFTLGGGQDLRRAFLELKSSGELTGLVLDLRGNGGGLLEEAVNMLGMFLPRGTEVVSSKGRYSQQDVTYKTKEEPIDTNIPIVVLVNQGSASSSEIVAGALQDLDRGVVVGTRTYGKGLVQAIRPLNYNAQLKMTTAKYYTPSGRCVQAIDYSRRNENGSAGAVPDSLTVEFKTKNGRSVFDGGGIAPDDRVESDAYNSRITIELLRRDLLWEYAVQYLIRHSEIAAPEYFTITDDEYNEFVIFMEQQEFDSRSVTQAMLEQILATSKREGYDAAWVSQLEELSIATAGGKAQDLLRHKTEIKRLLEEEICCVFNYHRGRVRSELRNDSQLERAKEILSDSSYYRALLNMSVVN